jgi:hypothetical protein
MATQDRWKKLTARKRGFNVQVSCVDCVTGNQFWGRCSTYTTKREAIEDAAERTAAGKTCRVVDFDGKVVG